MRAGGTRESDFRPNIPFLQHAKPPKISPVSLSPSPGNASERSEGTKTYWSHFGDNFCRRSSQVAERFSLELDLNLIWLHLQRAGQEGFNALFNRRTYFANNAAAQASH